MGRERERTAACPALPALLHIFSSRRSNGVQPEHKECSVCEGTLLPDGWTVFDSVRTSEWGIVWSETRGGPILPTPKSSVALNSSVPANRLTSVAAVLKASSIPLERWMHSERWIKRWKTAKATHALTGYPVTPPALVWNLFVLRSKVFTWAAGHITGSGLGGRAGVATWPGSLLVAVSTGDAARRPVAPVPLAVHIVWIRGKGREREILSSDSGHMLNLLRPVSMPH